MKVIGVYLERCTGCKTCELYCAVERGSSGKTLLKAVQETPVPKPRLRVERHNNACLAIQCRQCVEAPCLNACPSGALVRDPKSDLVVVREDRCIACWTCVMLCPFGVIFPWPERKFALKCDRCTHMEHPVCMEVCPTRALEVVDKDKIGEMYGEKWGIQAETADASGKEEGSVRCDLGS